MLPTRVSQVRSRYPLRSPVRSMPRSYFSAPTCCATSISINSLRQHTHPVAQEIHITIQFGLAQQLVKRHPQVLGHRLWSPFSEISTIPMETIRWSFVSTT